MRGEQLPLELRPVALEEQRVIILAVRSTVNPHDRGVASPAYVVGGLDDLTVDLRAVAACEADVLDGAQRDLREERAVLRAERAELSAFEGVDLEGRTIVGGEHGGMAGGGYELVHHHSVRELLDVTAVEVHLGGVLSAVILHGELDRAAIGGEVRRQHSTIQARRERTHMAGRDVRDREDIHDVGVVLELCALQECELPAIGAPLEPLMVR